VTATGVIRVGTRGSDLALRQARLVIDRLRRVEPRIACDLTIIRTRGDRRPGRLWPDDHPGLFTSELSDALLARRIDVAVHSLKDLPVEPAAGTGIAAVVDRADPRDAIVGRDGLTLRTLPSGAIVGTSSQRRHALVRAHRPDLRTQPVSGNVPSRIRAVDEGDCDAVVLAMAGLQRLEYTRMVSQVLPLDGWPPAPGQGAIALETRTDDERVARPTRLLDVPALRLAVAAERAAFHALGAGCRAPVGAFATWRSAEELSLSASVIGLGAGVTLTRAGVSRVRTADEALALGREVASRLLEAGAGDLLQAARRGVECA
jgi:hydroxymethylbilane synthase